MADEITPDTGNGTPAATPAEATPVADSADVRAAAIAAGFQVFDASEMHGLKTSAAAKAEAEAAQTAAKLASLQAEHAKLADWKTKQDNEGKSEAELHREQFRVWQETNKAKDAEIKAHADSNEGLQKQLELERVQNKISMLMPDAQEIEMALMWAKEKVGPRLSTNADGALVWTEPSGVPHEGIAAAQKFSEWYLLDGQKHLRGANTAGPPTGGAASPAPTASAAEYKPPPGASFQQKMEYAKEWEAKYGTRAPHQGDVGTVPKNTL